METLLVRLKPYDPRRGHVLRRFTYAGIKFQEERGWYRVEKNIADYLRTVREISTDRYSPLAFDVCTEEEARALEAAESEENKVRRGAEDALTATPARATGALTTESLPKEAPSKDERDSRRGKRERD